MRAAIVSPTYNERENIEWFLRSVREALPAAHVFVIDDSSPDGTGELAEKLAEELGEITVVHRAAKQGLGSAYRHGFQVACDGPYDMVITMDVDRSHDPVVLPTFVDAMEGGADVVFGSRYVPGGATVDWPLHRRLLSKWGNKTWSKVLGLTVHDCTSAYRAYRTDVLRDVDVQTTDAEGYAFLAELARRLNQQGKKIVEVPIVFKDRLYGESKMSFTVIGESMLLVTRWGISDAIARRRAKKAAKV
jgi:dolichol-phosphate mannosyltransferase